MKAKISARNISLALAVLLALTLVGSAQVDKGKDPKNVHAATSEPGTAAIPLPAPSSTSDAQPIDTEAAVTDDTILPYYNNYLKEYRLGPSDVISVEVFG